MGRGEEAAAGRRGCALQGRRAQAHRGRRAPGPACTHPLAPRVAHLS